MPITAEQRATRKKYIGSSDVAAICGRDPWRSAMDVYISKVSDLEEQSNEAMETGNRLERAVLEWGAEHLGVAIACNVFKVSGDVPIFAANHDAIIIDRAEGMEAKTVGILGRWNGAEEWGDEHTDEVPDHVLLQCQEQCYVSKLERVWVPVLIGGRGWCMFKVDRNDRLIKSIVERGLRFWTEFVEPRVLPPDSLPSLDVARSIRRQPGATTQVPAEVVERWKLAKDVFKQAEEDKDSAEALLRVYLAGAEYGDCALGQVRDRQDNTRRIDAAKLKAEMPDVYAKYEVLGTRRVLSLKEPKH